ncbi:MAG: DUF5606 domain-containing protein [Bacteroidaceae bacterium]|nr:DUF5606 domain-containing protein [Bacteroidaceae bacterium]
MLKRILAISGKPGLYKLISRGNRSLIVETLDEKKKRMPAMGTDKVISLNDIAMYTEEEEVPLPQVFDAVKKVQEGQLVTLDYKKASKDELFDFFAQVLPTFDRDRVHASDIKKLIQWYNLLLENGITEFVVEEEKAEEEAAAE